MEGSVACGISLVYRNLGARNKDYNFSFRLKTRICPNPGSVSALSLFASFLIIKTLLQQASVASLGGIVERAGAGAGAEVLQQVAGHQALLAFHPAHQSK